MDGDWLLDYDRSICFCCSRDDLVRLASRLVVKRNVRRAIDRLHLAESSHPG